MLALAGWICTAAPGRAVEPIALTMGKTATPGQVTLAWSGASAPYQVHRAGAPAGLVAPANLLARTNNTAYTDGAVGGFFYAAVKGYCGDSIVDLNEQCDDGNTLPGDGCSALCQIEPPASLTFSASVLSFGTVLAGGHADRSLTLTNTGSLPSGTVWLSLSGSGAAQFSILTGMAGDCVSGTTALAAGAACTVRIRFAPLAAGMFAATLTASATPGGMTAASLTGTGQWPLTLNRTGSGTLTRDGAAACGATCPETTGHANGASVTLVASPQNGSNSHFSGWSGDCAGPARTCVLTMTQARSATAVFSPQTYNLAFVSASSAATTLGSAAAYDARCNALATAAGLNNAAGTAYVAFVSDTGSNARSRLGAARGWVRVDGRPFADTMTGAFANSAILLPLRLDEYGADAGSQWVMTGTDAAGATGNHCNNWAGTGLMTAGDSAAGPAGWTARTILACPATARLYCLMNTKTAPLVVTPESGKRIFLSGPITPGGGAGAFDARCAADKPAGAGPVKALIATTSAAASGGLVAATRYVRPDGVFVGTGAELSAGGLLSGGIWQAGNGSYLAGQSVWTGAPDPNALGTPATTCDDWGSTLNSGLAGYSTTTAASWWYNAPATACGSTTLRGYCAEQ